MNFHRSFLLHDKSFYDFVKNKSDDALCSHRKLRTLNCNAWIHLCIWHENIVIHFSWISDGKDTCSHCQDVHLVSYLFLKVDIQVLNLSKISQLNFKFFKVHSNFIQFSKFPHLLKVSPPLKKLSKLWMKNSQRSTKCKFMIWLCKSLKLVYFHMESFRSWKLIGACFMALLNVELHSWSFCNSLHYHLRFRVLPMT
jgi:hypothetical protein